MLAQQVAIGLLQEGENGGGGFVALCINLFVLVFCVLMIVGLWKVFVKAGKPGWAAIIPIYDTLVWLQIVGRPWWWLLLLLIPVVNLVVSIIVTIDLAKVFGKGIGFALGLMFLTPIFLLILGFGDATYQGAPSR